MYFSTAASSENDHGSMNLASKTAPVASTRPSTVAASHRTVGCWTLRWTSVMVWPVLRSYQRRLRSSVARPSWTMRLPDEVLRLDLAAFLPPQPHQRRFIIAHDDPGVGAADEVTTVGRDCAFLGHKILHDKKWWACTAASRNTPNYRMDFWSGVADFIAATAVIAREDRGKKCKLVSVTGQLEMF